MNKIKIASIIVVVVVLGGALLAGALYTQGWDIGHVEFIDKCYISNGLVEGEFTNYVYRPMIKKELINIHIDNSSHKIYPFILMNRNTYESIELNDILAHININYIMIWFLLLLIAWRVHIIFDDLENKINLK